MIKIISKCEKCGGMTFCAVCDTPDDIMSVAKDIARLRKEGRSVERITHTESDPTPEWCDCI